jgi:hypothetical protein
VAVGRIVKRGGSLETHDLHPRSVRRCEHEDDLLKCTGLNFCSLIRLNFVALKHFLLKGVVNEMNIPKKAKTSVKTQLIFHRLENISRISDDHLPFFRFLSCNTTGCVL